MKLSKYFSLEELLASQTATRLGLDEQFKPPKEVVACLKNLCIKVLDKVREKSGKPIIVTSGYRCYRTNKAIGGAATSQHQHGQAVDITARGLTTTQLVDLIVASDIEFDQLIEEFGRWVHISYVEGRNRRQVLRAIMEGGKTKYLPYKG